VLDEQDAEAAELLDSDLMETEHTHILDVEFQYCSHVA
jgi:hypothetical protein